MKLFSTEQVSKYHPDKYADQISGAFLDAALVKNRNCKVAIETMVKNDTVIVAGETSETFTDNEVKLIITGVGNKLKYKVLNIINLIGTQSEQIAKAVNKTSIEDPAAGDQGIMFGYATRESKSLLPYGFDVANRIIEAIENDIETNENSILIGDAKCQVTVDLDESIHRSIHTILVSVCHKELHSFEEQKEIDNYMNNILDDVLSEIHDPSKHINIIINPSGNWTIGGPEADSGLTGRKIVCDQYGGYVPVGGGAFSGKDPSKVDVSASYIARYMATIALEKLPWLNEITIQLAYGIGIKEPLSINFEYNNPSKFKDREIEKLIKTFDLTPRGIINELRLKDASGIYERMAEGCHYFKNGSW